MFRRFLTVILTVTGFLVSGFVYAAGSNPVHAVKEIPMTFNNWDKLNDGEWFETNEGLKIMGTNYRGATAIKTKAVYDLRDAEIFVKWKAYSINYGAFIIGVFPGVYPIVNSGSFTTNHSYRDSVVIDVDTWYFTRIRISPDKTYTAVTSLNDYDTGSGYVLKQISAVLSDNDWRWLDRASVSMNMNDVYDGTNASMTVGEVRTDAAPVEIRWADSILYDFENAEIPSAFTCTGDWMIADTGFESSKSLHLNANQTFSAKLDAADVVQISFRVKHSASDFRDMLALYVDNKHLFASSTTDKWSDKLTFVIPADSKTLEFRLVEETTYSGISASSVWLDNIELKYALRNTLTVKPLTSASFGEPVEFIIEAEAKDGVWAVDFKDQTDSNALALQTASYIDNFFDRENLLRIPIKDGSGAITHRYPAEEITGKGDIVSLTYIVKKQCGEIITDFEGSFYDMNGNIVKTDVVNAVIFVDDGIHCGNGIISGTVKYPFGNDHSGIIVTIVIGDKEYSTVTDADGNFIFTDLRDGVFTIFADTPLFLSECREIEMSESVPVTVNLTMSNADINQDGEVGIADFTLLAGAYGTCVGETHFAEVADLNKSSCVDINDLIILARHWGYKKCRY